ncbi:citrate synthase (plasmid) [Rhizobium leguminosarum bv. trifolii WSM2304]|uniref:citrate synthase (unknown stereospecificity) n=1 Tax=Rhizobium leguminosarum bv. trifolii (strain WSM2304) TaxID=395492 RepID=A0ABF7QZ81_RHILW|nr:citryl-CoA lyase [Rhizobium leguminosarum]ACI59658.1 citrate synthase [Rhizobium leguminosarum bv. trifolii WSM2304]
MTKGTSSHWVTGVSEISAEEMYIRGYAMSDLVGAIPFPGIAYLLIRGVLPTRGQARMMDAIFSSILDYGLQKSGTVAARAVVSVNPAMTAGLGAAVLAAGEYALSPEDTGRFISTTFAQWKDSGKPMDEAAANLVAELRAAKRRVPGFGHQVFRIVDPRSEKLKKLAKEQGVWGEVNEWYEAVHRAFQAASNKPDLVLNDVGMLASIMVQMGFSPAEMCGLAIISTMPGLVAHISEELQSGVRNRLVPESHTEYSTARRELGPDLRKAGW